MKNLSKLIIVSLFAIGFTACGTAQNPVTATGTGYYNSQGQWVSTAGGNSCLSTLGQGLTLNFTASQIQVVSGRFFAGNIPAYGMNAGQHGVVTLGAGGMTQTYTSITLNKTASGGSINMVLDPNAATASGTITLSSAGLANTGILQQAMYGSAYGQASSTICVTGVALDVDFSANMQTYGSSTGQLISALVYLTLSNGQVVQAPVQIYQ